MNILTILQIGIKRASRSWRLAFLLYGISLSIAAPLSLEVRASIGQSIGHSMVHQNLRNGFDLAWYWQFRLRNRGVVDTFGPSVVGISPVLANIERFLDGNILKVNGIILFGGMLILAGWAFCSGGILDRYASPNEQSSRSRFLQQSARYFLQFLSLSLMSLTVYWSLFKYAIIRMSGWIQKITQDVTTERTAMAYQLLLYFVVIVVLFSTALIMDYTRIIMITRNSVNMFSALFQALGFITSNLGRTVGLYCVLSSLVFLIWIVYGLIAPGPTQSSVIGVLGAFMIGQAYLLARLVVKLAFWACQTALLQDGRIRERSQQDAPATARYGVQC